MNKPSDFCIKGRLKYAKDGNSVSVPESAGLRYIAVICDDSGKLSPDVNPLVLRWPVVDSSYKNWYRSSFGKMGELKGKINLSQVQSDTVVVHLLAVVNGKLDKNALRTCLDNLGKEAKYNGASIHMKKYSDNWKDVEALIDEQLLRRSLNVTVYDS